MGMAFNFLRASKEELDSYLNDSSLLEERAYEFEGDDESSHYIDKAWEAIFYILTGITIRQLESEPYNMLGKALFSNQAIDEEQDMGYGPAYYLLPEQVKEINELLNNLPSDFVKQKYSPEEFNKLGIYPSGGWQADALEYLIESFDEVKNVYQVASNNNQAVITFIN